MTLRIAGLYRRAYSGLPRQAWILFAVQLVNSSGMMVIFFLTLYLTRRLDFSLQQAGRTLSIFGFGSLAGSYLGGWLSDRIGSTNVQKISLTLSGILYITLGQVSTLIAIDLLVFVLAAASTALQPANSTSMARVCPPEMTSKGFALNRLANNIGATIGPAVGGFLALRNYKLLFWVDGLTCLTAAVLFVLIWKKPEQQMRTMTHSRPTDGPEKPRSPWRDRLFLGLLPLAVLWGTVFFQLLSTFPVYLREVYGFRENRIGQLIIINTLLIITLEMILIHWIKPRWMTRFIALAFVLTGLGFALLPWGRGFVYAGFTVMVWTFGEMLSMPLMGALIAGRAGPGGLGRYMGLFSFAYSLALIFGPVAGTAVYERFGPTVLWSGCGVAGIILALGFSGLMKTWKPGPAGRPG